MPYYLWTRLECRCTSSKRLYHQFPRNYCWMAIRDFKWLTPTEQLLLRTALIAQNYIFALFISSRAGWCSTTAPKNPDLPTGQQWFGIDNRRTQTFTAKLVLSDGVLVGGGGALHVQHHILGYWSNKNYHKMFQNSIFACPLTHKFPSYSARAKKVWYS